MQRIGLWTDDGGLAPRKGEPMPMAVGHDSNGVVSFALAKAQDRIKQLEASINKERQLEREACAKVAEEWFGVADEVAAGIANAIRARQ